MTSELLYCVLYYNIRFTGFLKISDIKRWPCISDNYDCVGTQGNEECQLRQELKITRRLAIYITVFAIFYFPIEIVGVIENIFNFSSQPWFFDNYVPVKVWLAVLSQSSSAFNPLLYGLSSSVWRRSILATLRCKRLQQVAPSETYSSTAIRTTTLHWLYYNTECTDY